MENFDAALSAFRNAIAIDPGNSDAHKEIGKVLSSMEDFNSALVEFRNAIAIDPENADAYKGLASLLGYMGESGEAIAALRKEIALKPDRGHSYRMIASYKKFVEHDSDLQTMETAYASDDLTDDARMHIAFGLGKAYEDLGEYEKSMQFILQATRLKRNALDYSIAESESLFERVKNTYSRDFTIQIEGQGNPDPTPIFILGMPRSGTTLTEQILASHPDVFGAGELHLIAELVKQAGNSDTEKESIDAILKLTPEELNRYGQNYIEKIRAYGGDARFITDKMPHNFIHIGFIRAILPNARIVHLQRDPVDNCLSIFKNFFARGHYYSYDLTELGQYYKLYLDLMAYWRDLFPGVIFDLSYEKLVSDQEQEIARLLDYCGLPWNDACLEFHKPERTVRTASKTQVRRPIYRESVKLWKRYEKELQPLMAALE